MRGLWRKSNPVLLDLVCLQHCHVARPPAPLHAATQCVELSADVFIVTLFHTLSSDTHSMHKQDYHTRCTIPYFVVNGRKT